MMEQSRHARKFFDLAWFGIGAAGAVDPMVAFAATSRITWDTQVLTQEDRLTTSLFRLCKHLEISYYSLVMTKT